MYSCCMCNPWWFLQHDCLSRKSKDQLKNQASIWLQNDYANEWRLWVNDKLLTTCIKYETVMYSVQEQDGLGLNPGTARHVTLLDAIYTPLGSAQSHLGLGPSAVHSRWVLAAVPPTSSATSLHWLNWPPQTYVPDSGRISTAPASVEAPEPLVKPSKTTEAWAPLSTSGPTWNATSQDLGYGFPSSVPKGPDNTAQE